MSRKKYINVCINCKVEYHPFNRTSEFCSRKCSGSRLLGNELWKLNPISEETRKKLSIAGKSRRLSKKHKENIGKKHKGKKLSKITKRKLSSSWTIEKRKKMSLSRVGKKNPAWIDGRKTEARRIRHSLEYRLWREAVFKRDDWKCVFCDRRGKIRIEADHIKPFSTFSELRLEVSNGRTLCVDCHRNTETYGGRINA